MIVALAIGLPACASRQSPTATAPEPAAHPAIVQGGAPGEDSRPVQPGATGGAARRYAPADVQFMQHMLVHHAQALEMTALVPERTTTREVRLLAERIEASQHDEIAQMQQWLRSRGEPLPGAHAHHDAGVHERMPGMLSPDRMRELAAARGADFDRLFLRYMIEHHEGALVMVDTLMSSGIGAQEPESFEIASHVFSDQQMEIARMRSLLATLLQRGSQ